MCFKVFAAVLLIMSVFSFAPHTVFSCSCPGMPYPPEESFSQARAVFSGKVLSIENVGDNTWEWHEKTGMFPYRKVEMLVFKNWKGIEGERVIVRTGTGSDDCGFDFQESEEYLIYAHGPQSGAELGTGICSRTKLLAQADEDLTVLEQQVAVIAEESDGPPPQQNPTVEVVGEMMELLTNPLTNTVINAPWHVAFLILAAYFSPIVFVLYFMFKKFIRK